MDAKLIRAPELNRRFREESVAIFDCRFALNDPDAGRAAFEDSHIPGARYADLEQDLSGPVSSETGRHPLPAFGLWLETVTKLEVDSSTPIVLYDGGPGVFAARLWWMLNWAGIENVMLLDGGFSQWRKEGFAVQSGEESDSRPGSSAEAPAHDIEHALHVNAQFLMEHLHDPQVLILDAREEERFSGRKEPLDKKAGCIPGAFNRHFALNLSEGLFKSPTALRAEFEEVMQGLPPESVVHSCGSGVTACHNLFAMEYAGLSGSRLYPGSWSEWIVDPARPIDVRG